MNISLQNIGMVREANISFDGIAVICGYNDTGKSTVGRTLQSIFNSLCLIDEDLLKYQIEKLNRLSNDLDRELDRVRYIISKKKSSNDYRNLFLHEDIATSYRRKESIILNKTEISGVAMQEMIKQIEHQIDQIELLVKKQNSLQLPLDFNFYRVILESIVTSRKEHITGEKIKENIYEIFDGSIENKLQKSKIKSSFKFAPDDINPLIECNIHNDSIESKVNLESLGSINKCIYLEPTGDNFTKEEDAKSLDDKMKDVLKEISSIINGSFVLTGANRYSKKIKYEKQGQYFGLPIVASGIKSFGMIYRLVASGQLDSNTMLIIDEPELHQHPEWQLKMAEILVVISQKLLVPIIITTHSDILLNCIDRFNKKLNFNNISYYLAQKSHDNDNFSDIKEVDDISKIVEHFISPYFEFNNIYSYENEDDENNV